MGKAKNGSLDAATASELWKQKFEAPGAITDKKGDHPRYRDRVAISTKDLVTLRDADIKAQSYILKDKEQKKVEQQDIDKAELRLTKDRQLKASSDMSRMDQAAAMARASEAAGAEGAFSSDGKMAVQIGNIRDLVDEDMSDGDQAADDDPPVVTPTKSKGREDESEPGSTTKQPPAKKPKKEAWFDRDGAVASALRGHQQWLATTKTAISGTIQDLTGTLDSVTAEIADEVNNETRLAKNRLCALKLISCQSTSDAPIPESVEAEVASTLGSESKNDDETKAKADVQPEPEKQEVQDNASTVHKFVKQSDGDAKKALRRYIAQFSDATAQKVLGNAPPCRSYQSLILFTEFEAYLDKFQQIEKKDDILQIQQSMKAFKTAYSDLISMAKAANKRLATAIETVIKEKEKAKVGETQPKGKGKGAKGRGRGAKKTSEPAAPSFVEQPNSVASDIPSVVVKSDGLLGSDFEVGCPTILRLDACHTSSADMVAVKNMLVHLEAKFKNDPAKLASGRSQMSLPAEQRQYISDLIFKCFPKDYVMPVEKLTEKVKQEVLIPSVFIVAKDWATASAEAGHLPTCRLGVSGSRTVVAVRTLPLLEFLTKCGMGGAKADLPAAYNWVKSASVQAAKAFVDACSEKVMCHATVGPNDVLYMPEGWMFYEKIMPKHSFLGVRLQFLSVKCLPHLEEVNNYLLALGKPNAALQSAVDCISLAE